MRNIFLELFRKKAEKYSEGMILKRKMRIQGKLVSLFVSPDSQLKYFKFDKFDDGLIQIAEKYITKESHIWDIGANVGVFGYACSVIAKNGSVLLVEPDLFLANILYKTSRLKEFINKKIIIISAAITDKNAISELEIASRGRAANSLKIAHGSSQMGGVREIQYTPSLTLDLILDSFLTTPDFVKIDIEGSELLAINGAKRLINDIRPIFFIEVSRHNFFRLFKIFKQSDYSAFNVNGERLLHDCEENTLFIPN
jgi:FkbM family methyltransferase